MCIIILYISPGLLTIAVAVRPQYIPTLWQCSLMEHHTQLPIQGFHIFPEGFPELVILDSVQVLQGPWIVHAAKQELPKDLMYVWRVTKRCGSQDLGVLIL